MMAEQLCLSRRLRPDPLRVHRQLPQAGEPRRRLRPLPREPRRTALAAPPCSSASDP